jgi:hypothetical protein
MNDFIIYVLKSVLALGIFSLVYRIILSNEGNFPIRRIYLLISVSLAIILPLITFSFSFIEYSFPSVVLDEVVIYSNGIRLIRETSSFPVAKILRVLYFMIAGVLIFRVLLNTILVLIKANRNNPDYNEGVKIYILKDKNISYSFFRNIFIGQTAGPDEQERIFAHEKVHAIQFHSIDVMYIEFLSAIFWFNPLVWWYRKEIKNVHEYLADQGALEKGFNRKLYQITLLEHLIGSASLSITNSFNYSLIKNRIAMMNKEKTNRKNTWKVFLLVPLSLLIAFAFACTQKSQIAVETTDLSAEPILTAYYEPDQMPVFPGGMEAFSKFIAYNVIYPPEAKDNGFAGKVFVQFVVDTDGKIVTKPDKYTVYDKTQKESSLLGEVTVVGYKPAEGSPTENADKYIELLKAEAVRVISSLPAFEKPGVAGGKPVAVVYTIPISFVLQ